jgi:putative transcriptional regulator
MVIDNYKGKLLIAQPKSKGSFFEESVVLVVSNTLRGSWGLIINKMIPDDECCLADILEHVGMDNANYVNAPLFVGGPVERSRVCIVHSNDWSSASTIEVTPEISVTTDISILAALANNIGPEKYKIMCGVSGWGSNQLEGEMSGKEPWTPGHKWLVAPATARNVFDLDQQTQWHHMIAEAVNLEVKEWF